MAFFFSFLAVLALPFARRLALLVGFPCPVLRGAARRSSFSGKAVLSSRFGGFPVVAYRSARPGSFAVQVARWLRRACAVRASSIAGGRLLRLSVPLAPVGPSGSNMAVEGTAQKQSFWVPSALARSGFPSPLR